MGRVRLDRRTAGTAVAAGYLLLLAALALAPGDWPGGATASARATLFLLVLPVGGLLAGVYARLGGPFGGLPLFVAASYLGVFGLALAFVVGGAFTGLLSLLGLGLAALAALALVAAVWGYLSALAGGAGGSPAAPR